MIKSQINELKLKVAEDVAYAVFRMSTGTLSVAMTGIDAAKLHLQQLIDDERAREERREYEIEIMIGDEHSEEPEE